MLFVRWIYLQSSCISSLSRANLSRKVVIQGLRIDTTLGHHRVAKMTAKKNKTTIEQEALKRVQPTLEPLKRKWRARVASIVKKLETEQENIRLKKENTDLREQMEETGRELTTQKLLASNRLVAMKCQAKLKEKAKNKVTQEKEKVQEQKVKGEKRRIGEKNAEEEKKKEKRARIEAGKKAKEANQKKREAIDRAKKAEKSLNELNGQMVQMNKKWSKNKIERRTLPTIVLPLKNPFNELEEKQWLQATIEALPESVRPKISALVAK